MKRLSMKLTMLIMLMSCFLSLKSYAQDIEGELEAIELTEPQINFDLELPEGTKITTGKETGVFFNLDEYKTVVSIYQNYIGLADESIMLSEDMFRVQEQYESCLREVDKSDRTIHVLNDNNKRMYNMTKEQIKREEDTDRKKMLFGGLTGGVGIIVGVAAGVILGLTL